MSAPLLLTSPLLAGVPHAFSTRIGGVSAAPFESLNLGNPSELSADRRDPPANIRENFRRILGAMGCEGRTLTEVHQVHGAAVHTVRRGDLHPTPDPKADAIVTDDPSRILIIRVADCAPVLLTSSDGAVVAAVHAGWRGAAAGVLPAAINAMRVLGAQGISAAIGPCITQAHFEVGPEVAAEFRRLFPDTRMLRPGARDRWMLDLKMVLELQARAANVERIDVLPYCTFAQPDLFYSHRRDRGVTGRTAGLIGPTPRP